MLSEGVDGVCLSSREATGCCRSRAAARSPEISVVSSMIGATLEKRSWLATSEFSSCVITRHPSNVENVLLNASIRYNIKEQSLKPQKQETPCDNQAVYR